MKHQQSGKTNLPVSYYEILQVSERAGDLEIKAAYHRLAKRFHPDMHPHETRLAEMRFRLINEAYANLKTLERRRHYNRILKSGPGAMPKIKPRPKARNDNKKPQGTHWLLGFIASFGLKDKKA